MKKPTQVERLLQYIDDFGFITTWQAMFDLGIGSPTKCVSNARKSGAKIETKIVYHKNRYGDLTRHAEYRRA